MSDENEAILSEEIMALRRDLDRLAALLGQRDHFIVDEGLWTKFVANLPPLGDPADYIRETDDA